MSADVQQASLPSPVVLPIGVPLEMWQRLETMRAELATDGMVILPEELALALLDDSLLLWQSLRKRPEQLRPNHRRGR